MKTQYCAIIGDINKSRQLEKRGMVQKKFEKAVEFINTEYKSEIASKFLITIGDEFQGLLHTPAKGYQIMRHFREIMEPVQFSFGADIGTLATPVAPKAAIGMDGECFHRARAALQHAKKNGGSSFMVSPIRSIKILPTLLCIYSIISGINSPLNSKELSAY